VRKIQKADFSLAFVEPPAAHPERCSPMELADLLVGPNPLDSGEHRPDKWSFSNASFSVGHFDPTRQNEPAQS
jgi:hypothetical protein